MGRVYITLILFISLIIFNTCDKSTGPTVTDYSDDPLPEEQHVLFFGSSLMTLFIDIPGIFAELARYGRHLVQVTANKDGSFQEHINNDSSMAMLHRRKWDHVVIVEHSLIASDSTRWEHEMIPAAITLDSLIKSQGAKTTLYIQCAYKRGVPGSGDEGGGYGKMQDQLIEGVTNVANLLDVPVVPLGVACKTIRFAYQQEFGQDLELWWQDNLHPSMESAYLAACMLYAVIFGESPEGLTFRGGLGYQQDVILQTHNLDGASTSFLQRYAAEIVLTDPERWNLE